MKTRNKLIVASLALIFVGTLCAGLLKWRGFRATSTPSTFETVAARSVRDFAIPAAERHRANPDAGDSSSIQQGREDSRSNLHGRFSDRDEPPLLQAG
jgi:hypothetical protein